MLIRKLKTIFIFGLIATTSLVFAQETKKEAPKYGWQKNMVGSINVAQTSFDNWTQGGENNLAWQINLNGKFVNDQEKTNWANSGKFSFGKSKVGDKDARKSIDEIKLESVLTYKLGGFINPFIAATGETQSAKGYNYTETDKIAVSGFFDPAYFRQSIGVGYAPNEEIKTRLGFSAKETITSDFPVPYADDPETAEIEKTRTEIGIESVTDLNKKINKNTLLTSKLELFSNLGAFDEIDVNWDNVFTAKVSKYIDVNFNIKLFYDKNVSKKRQIKQALTLGLTYTFLE